VRIDLETSFYIVPSIYTALANRSTPLRAVFESESKKLIIEKKDVNNNQRIHRSELDLANMQASKISQLHMATEMLFMVPLDSLKPKMPD
jgi:hypothetical protein